MARDREEKIPPPPGQEVRRGLLGGLVIMLFAVQLLSDRPLNAVSLPVVAPVSDIPARANLPQLRSFVSAYGMTVIVPRRRMPFVPVVATEAAKGDGVPRLGYLVREFNFFAMPFYASRDPGFAIYTVTDGRLQVQPLDDAGLDLLAQQAGKRLESGYVFPFWYHAWGWLFVIGLLIVAGLELRANTRHRAALGIM